MDSQTTCTSCGAPAEGYKCSSCDLDMENCDPNHACGPGTCEPKCSTCHECSSKCSCIAQS